MFKKFYLWLSLLSSVVLAVFILLAGYREMSPEWREYQVNYRKRMIESAPDQITRNIAKATKIGIQQIYIDDLGRVDRCTSCHTGFENPLMADVPLPFGQHSGEYLQQHPVEQFGCTICHHGQGRATNKHEAHGWGHDVHWDPPLIPNEYIQSSCAVCHDTEDLKTKGGTLVAGGKALFQERGCLGCHKLNGVGGTLGKALDGVGSQPAAYFSMTQLEGEGTIYTWMKEHFVDPRNVVPGSAMLVDLNDRESSILTTYILSLRNIEIPIKYRRTTGAAGSDFGGKDGAGLYKMYCVACHTTGKESVFDEVFKRSIPAIMNPAFLRTIDDEYLKTIVSEGRADTQMTGWKSDAAGLSETELDRIITHVTRDRPLGRPEPFGFDRFEGNTERGGRLYQVRCMGCHGDKGQGGVGLNLANPVVKMAPSDFLAITVRDGRLGTSMAPFGGNGVGLKDQDIVDVVTYVQVLGSPEGSGNE